MKTKVEYKVVITQQRGDRRHSKTYTAKNLEKAVEMYEEFLGYIETKRLPYWARSTVKIQTREVTNWRTYHHVTEE